MLVMGVERAGRGIACHRFAQAAGPESKCCDEENCNDPGTIPHKLRTHGFCPPHESVKKII
jgi:hypothetical protein